MAKVGENHTDNFHMFYTKDRRSDRLFVVGKKCMIIFYVHRCDTNSSCQDILSFTFRTLPERCMNDSGEYHDAIVIEKRKKR